MQREKREGERERKGEKEKGRERERKNCIKQTERQLKMGKDKKKDHTQEHNKTNKSN